jgi:hypothetical protein
MDRPLGEGRRNNGGGRRGGSRGGSRGGGSRGGTSRGGRAAPYNAQGRPRVTTAPGFRAGNSQVHNLSILPFFFFWFWVFWFFFMRKKKIESREILNIAGI